MFTHLHVHSHYSLLDGLPKIADLVSAAKNKGFNSLAITDHGVLYGAVEFYKICLRENIKPIIGLEAYVAARGLKQKEGRLEDKSNHLTLLAKNYEGYKNLMKLTSIAHIEGFYYKPRIDFETLIRFSEGLVVLSGCVNSELSQSLLSGNLSAAQEIALRYKENFPHYYIEIQRQKIEGDPDFASKQTLLNDRLITLANKLSIPLVATADSHYLDPGDAEAQDILVCISTGRTIEEQDRLTMRHVNLSLASEKEMLNLFSDIPQAIEESGRIAELVDIEIPLGTYKFPRFEIPQDSTHEMFLRRLAFEGLAREYNIPKTELRKKLPEETKRLEYELGIIIDKGYPSYFLIVADFANWARQNDIIATTRGSAAGSLVAFVLGITTINPLAFNLPFERFLNPERPSAPDIDMDFADTRRDEVIEYVSQKYGRDKVAQIVTFGTMMARAAVRDVGRALGVAYSKCDRIAKLIPFGRQGFPMTIKEAIKISPDLKRAYKEDAESKRILDLSQKVEGVARHASVHAAGVVISPTPLTDFTPLRADTETGTITTQYDMHACEDVGLVKMDFLGIRNLSILGSAVTIVKKTKNLSVDLDKLPLDDKKTYELLAAGNTVGLFQLGGAGMTRYLKELKPTKIEDIMAMIALYRPGPMESIPEFIRRKHDATAVSYLDPSLREILESSYGILTYQDDVLLIAIKIAGYSWLEADKLRKAMGKKIPKEMAEQKEKFIDGSMKNGWTMEKTVKLWALIEPFAAYGFNKAHAASYGIVAYQTAYMKANFPVAYMAAVLTAESSNLETVAEAVAECTNMGIAVLPPDVNESLSDFTVIDDERIRFGLSAIKNLGSDVVEKIIEERKGGGQFKTLSEFISRTFVKNFNKKSWEALAKCGALDGYGERNQLLSNTDYVLNVARSFAKDKESGTSSLFGEQSSGTISITLTETEPVDLRQKLAWEKELLGLYVSSHPLEEFKVILAGFGESVAEMKKNHKERRVTFGGIITKVKTILTKKGDQMCFAEVEDLTGSVELVVFPKTFNDSRSILITDTLVKISGKFTEKDGEPKILADKIESLERSVTSDQLPGGEDLTSEKSSDLQATSYPSRLGSRSEADKLQAGEPQSGSTRQRITIPIPEGADPGVFQRLKKVFEDHPGEVAVTLTFPSPHGFDKKVETEFKVSADDAFKKSVKSLLKIG